MSAILNASVDYFYTKPFNVKLNAKIKTADPKAFSPRRSVGIGQPQLLAEAAELFDLFVLQGIEGGHDVLDVLGKEVRNHVLPLRRQVNLDVAPVLFVPPTFDEPALDEIADDGADVAFALKQLFAQLALVHRAEVIDGLQDAELAGREVARPVRLADCSVDRIEGPREANVRGERTLFVIGSVVVGRHGRMLSSEKRRRDSQGRRLVPETLTVCSEPLVHAFRLEDFVAGRDEGVPIIISKLDH